MQANKNGGMMTEIGATKLYAAPGLILPDETEAENELRRIALRKEEAEKKSSKLTPEEEVEAAIAKIEQRREEVEKRMANIKVFHEHIIAIHRLEQQEILTFLELAETSIAQRRRASWYGEVIAVSNRDCGDDILEKKKKDLKVGDVVCFNPESAYSLNVAEFEEIWILHLDNILCIDYGFNLLEARKENLHQLFIAQQRNNKVHMAQLDAAEKAAMAKRAASITKK